MRVFTKAFILLYFSSLALAISPPLTFLYIRFKTDPSTSISPSYKSNVADLIKPINIHQPILQVNKCGWFN